MPAFRRTWAAVLAVLAGTGGAIGGEPAAALPISHGAPTVVAVVEPNAPGGNGFNPYHFDFLGSQHPWTGGDPADDIDFDADPAGYVTDYPSVTALGITIPGPTETGRDVSDLHDDDSAVWSGMELSTPAVPKMYRFPGTKIIGALDFDGGFFDDNDAHGTRSAASAAGNIHGTCPECLLVLVKGTRGLAWALSQSWIDVVTNSWESNKIGAGPSRLGIYSEAPDTAAAVERGQSVLFAAGNGMVNAMDDAPQFTYSSSQRGPDWVVTVGGTDGGGGFTGSGKPVDVSAQAADYPSTGNLPSDTVTGTGTHSGTSNATPVVAGAIAKVIQLGRDQLGDQSGGQAGGVVAAGTPVSCGTPDPDCPLANGELTREEAENVVFHNVRPRPALEDNVPTPPSSIPAQLGTPSPTLPTTRAAYYYIGHGVVHGRDDPTAMAAEQARFRDALAGTVTPYQRPPGERAWMVADSQCRQRIWGDWSGGYYTGGPDDEHGDTSPLATAWNAWCTEEVAAQFRTLLETVPEFHVTEPPINPPVQT